ncbi:MAG: RtcB family protein [Bacteroidales bacterium]|nr:RtcB family protein [Bacteroidales bacterium]
MIKEIRTEKLPIKLWLDEPESGALEQAKNLANYPYALKHIALMPDCHQGFGMPIGGVMATKDVVVPNAVGVDIGCGMCAVQTSLTEISRPDLLKVLSGIRSRVPLGFKHHKVRQNVSLMPPAGHKDNTPVVDREFDSATRQIGTLGGGNHFIEIQKGSDGRIWVMIHSGSRNIGKQVADYYNRLAVRLNEKWKSPVPRAHQLAYLPLDSKEGRQYIREMEYCVAFAFASRKLMMERSLDVMASLLRGGFDTAPMINIAHNYAAFEDHFGQEVVVHRKGATRAGKETVGIIPGSQGTQSYIVKGKGNKDSFESCSHGAGRTMGRKEAIRSLNLAEEMKKLNDKGILHAIRSQRDLEEATSAYKDINQVMEYQQDLVDVLCELSPLAVIKG